MTYPIKTLNQLPLLLKAFRKEQGLTQAAMAEKLGITQQSYAHFEAKPATATLERLLTVLRLLNVDISLEHAQAVTASETPRLPEEVDQNPPSIADAQANPSAPQAIQPIKKESW